MSEELRSLFLVRGLPGAGKTSLAYLLEGMVDQYRYNCTCVAADDYFSKHGGYDFDVSKLGAAHRHCEEIAGLAMSNNVNVVIVHNTFTTEKEMKPYKEMANKYNYKTIQIIVENTHGNSSVHNVPEETMQRMKDRFKVTL